MSSALTLMSDPATFEHYQRVAKMYASSELIPPHLRGKVADVTIALTMAQEMGENPVVVMQNIYVVSGRAGWSSAYVIAKANRSGVFKGRIDWQIEGDGKSLTVTAFATLASTGGRVAYTVSMAMADAEGWTKNPKYKTMPELMLRYRSGTALVRLYAWDVMLGTPSVEELETYVVEEGVEVVAAPRRAPSLAQRIGAAPAIDEGPAAGTVEAPDADPTPAERERILREEMGATDDEAGV